MAYMKKVVALLLTLALIISLCPATFAANIGDTPVDTAAMLFTYNDGTGVCDENGYMPPEGADPEELVSLTRLADESKGFVMNMYAKTDTTVFGTTLTFLIDTTKVLPARANGTSSQAGTLYDLSGNTTIGAIGSAGVPAIDATGTFSAQTTAAKMLDDKIAAIKWSPAGDGKSDSQGKYVYLGSFRFGYVGTTTSEDLDSNTIRLVNNAQTADGYGIAFDGAAIIYTGNGGVNYGYQVKPNTESTYTAWINAPTLVYPNSTKKVVSPLASIDVAADPSTASTTIAVPKTDTATLNLKATATGEDTSDITSDTTGINWKLVATNDSTAEAVSINGVSLTGNNAAAKLTVSPAAAASLASTTNNYWVVAYKGNIASTPVAVTFTRENLAVTSVAYTATTNIAATIPTGSTANTYTVEIEVKDQYGNPMSGQAVTWNAGSVAGVTLTDTVTTTAANGKATAKLNVANTATAGTSGSVTATVGGKTANRSFSISALPEVKLTPKSGAAATVLGFDAANGKTLTAAGLNATELGNTNYTSDSTGTTWAFQNGSQVLAWGANTVALVASAPNKSSTPVNVTVFVKKTLTGADVTVSDKTYDGTTALAGNATFTIDSAKLGGKTVSVKTLAGTYNSAAVGSKNIAVSNLEFEGTDFANFFAKGANGTAKGNITPADLTLSAKTGKAALKAWTLASLVNSDIVAGENLDTLLGELTATSDPAVYENANGITVTFEKADGSEITALEAGVEYDVTIEVAADKAVGNYTLKADSVTSTIEFTEDVYTITYVVGANGTTEDPLTAVIPQGDKLAGVPQVTAKDGYEFTGWAVNGKTIDVATYMPTADVTVTAVFKALEKNPYINGMGKGKFEPNTKANRAQIAKMLAMLSADFDPDTTYPDCGLTGMEKGAWYVNYVNFCVEKGIIKGYQDGSFGPAKEITRAEFATMLARFIGVEDTEGNAFTDVSQHWAYGAIQALAEDGIIKGYEESDGTYTFRPNQSLTRQETVVMINRAVGLVYDADAEYEVTFSDIRKDIHFGYGDIMAAANTDVKEIIANMK